MNIEQTVKELFEKDTGYRYMKDTSFDYWKTPQEFEEDGGGDCEDWCIWWRQQLIRKGIPEVDIRMTWIPWTPKESHIILLIRDENCFWCMNIFSYFVMDMQYEDLIDTFGEHGKHWRMFTGSTTDIPQWNDCLQRMEINLLTNEDEQL